MQRGEFSHADLDKPFGKVKEIDDRIEAVEAQIEQLVEEQEAARETAEADNDETVAEAASDVIENG